MNWYYPDGNTTVPAGPRGTNPNSINGNAVLYDAVAGNILTLGGAPNYGVRAPPLPALQYSPSSPVTPPQCSATSQYLVILFTSGTWRTGSCDPSLAWLLRRTSLAYGAAPRALLAATVMRC